MITIELEFASDRDRGYGIEFVSSALYEMAGPNVHNPLRLHKIQVWSNVGRENLTPDVWNEFSGRPGPGRWLDPNGKGTDDQMSVLTSPQPILITNPPTPGVRSGGVVRIGDTVALVFPVRKTRHFTVCAKPMHNPHLVPID